jgi:hypothetical protein
MCDYCGCRSRPLIAEFGDEHERIADLSGELRRQIVAGTDDEAVAVGARRLVEVLAAHSAREVGGLYVELDASGIDTGAMHAEHHHIDDALADAAAGRVDRSALVQALDLLARHVHDEEYDLFPAAHQLLDDAAWDRIQR